MELSARAVTAPRLDIEPVARAAAHASLVVTQVRRALRSLLGQRGGTMLLRAWEGGGEVRIDCSVSGATAVADIECGDESCAAAIRAASVELQAECARRGCALAQIECRGPARSLMPAA